MSGARQTIFFAALALAGFTGAAWADYFLHGYYTPATGKVGQYFTSDAAFGVDDMPGQCVVVWDDIAIAGTLPPGLDIANSFSSVIAGTPTRPGDFAATVTFHNLGCSAIPGGRADRSIKVNFHITP
jgi:hypothetical protein